MGDDGPRPGLLILDMSNDQIKGVAYNKAAVLANVAQLALSDFFHVCIDSKQEVPGFRAKQKGAKLVDELVSMEHINHFDKKEDSALTNPKVLESLKSLKITHVCVCGTSTDSSVMATAADLVSNGFEIFVVKDATTSKNGKFGHDKGLRDIQSKFGDSVVVGIDDLLGAEEIVEETVADSTSEWVEEVIDDSYAEETVASEDISPAEKARLADAAKLAARKQKVDEQRFAHIKQANAQAKAAADPKRAAEIEKDTAAAETYASNLPQNKAAAAAATPAVVPEQKAAAPVKEKKKGMFGGLFGKKKNKEPAPAPAPAPAPKAAAPAPAPKPAPAEAPKPRVATSVPGGGAGQKTWIKPLPEGQKKTTYTADGAVSQPLGVKKQVQGNSVQERIRGLQEGGIRTVPTGPRKMKTPKIVTDTKETWDKQGNITREITRYITEIDGTKRTEKEVVKIPAKK